LASISRHRSSGPSSARRAKAGAADFAPPPGPLVPYPAAFVDAVPGRAPPPAIADVSARAETWVTAAGAAAGAAPRAPASP
jgi:hypothetical protein